MANVGVGLPGTRGGGLVTAQTAVPPPPANPVPEENLPDAPRKPGYELLLVYALWIIVMYDPQWWLARYTSRAVLRIPTLMLGLLPLLLAFKGVKRRALFVPLLLFLTLGFLTMFESYNRGETERVLKQVLLFYLLNVSTITFVKHPKQAVPIALILLWMTVWWGLHGFPSGRVRWHPTNNNFDGFGPQMVVGLGYCYFVGLTTSSRKLKLVARVGALLALVGIVASFARGAVLATGAVAGYIWLRSPRKVWTAGALVGALVVVIGVSGVLFPDGRFWDEMKSSFTEGSDEGTGADRKVLWSIATEVWKRNPFMGVGLEGFGPYAAATFTSLELKAMPKEGGSYGENPGRLYTRQLHSIFFQILAETGLFGASLYLYMLYVFWKKSRLLQTKRFDLAWRKLSGSEIPLRGIAFGLESAMVGYLCTGFFYDQLWVPWAYMTLGANALFYAVLRPYVGAFSAAAPPQRTR